MIKEIAEKHEKSAKLTKEIDATKKLYRLVKDNNASNIVLAVEFKDHTYKEDGRPGRAQAAQQIANALGLSIPEGMIKEDERNSRFEVSLDDLETMFVLDTIIKVKQQQRVKILRYFNSLEKKIAKS